MSGKEVGCGFPRMKQPCFAVCVASRVALGPWTRRSQELAGLRWWVWRLRDPTFLGLGETWLKPWASEPEFLSSKLASYQLCDLPLSFLIWNMGAIIVATS